MNTTNDAENHASTTEAQRSAIVRSRDLEAVWYLPRAKEPGFMRWLVTWVGGPPGYVNPSLGTSVVNENMAVGFMSLPRGQRQEGLHAHTVAEIYVVVKGALLGWDGRGATHVAEVGDCIYIPAGVPHGVRCYGSQDAELIWVHDGVEKKGAAVYFTGPGPFPQTDEIRVVTLKDLEPEYTGFKAKEPEFIRWYMSYVTREDLVQSPITVQSKNVQISLLAIEPAQKEIPFSSETDELYVVLSGKVIVNHGPQKGAVLDKLDGAFFGHGELHAVRNWGSEIAYIVTVKTLRGL